MNYETLKCQKKNMNFLVDKVYSLERAILGYKGQLENANAVIRAWENRVKELEAKLYGE